MKTYVVYKFEGRWVTETPADNGKPDRHHYTARRRAVNGILRQHPGTEPFRLTMGLDADTIPSLLAINKELV